ncbi:MAG: cytochrome b5 domain-containing protein [archaeon]
MKTAFILIALFLVGCAGQAPEPGLAAADVQVQPAEAAAQASQQPQGTELRQISAEELSMHATSEDCWIVYEGQVYDYTNAPRHPEMDKVFFAHCGKESGFEEGAKARHSKSSEERVANYGDLVGRLA